MLFVYRLYKHTRKFYSPSFFFEGMSSMNFCFGEDIIFTLLILLCLLAIFFLEAIELLHVIQDQLFYCLFTNSNVLWSEVLVSCGVGKVRLLQDIIEGVPGGWEHLFWKSTKHGFGLHTKPPLVNIDTRKLRLLLGWM